MDSINFIRDVSDTSIWVAHYRAEENKRADRLFSDPFAEKLVGRYAQDVNNIKGQSVRFTKWSVVMRTLIIDKMLEKLISEGVDTVINLGCGLDTRPYRMKLPSQLNWIEVDYPKIIEYKSNILMNEKPQCVLKRISLDLSNHDLRKDFFKEELKNSKNVVILTEGVIPYLKPEMVKELSNDLMGFSNVKFWITEYLNEKSYKYLKDPKRMKALKNAPFQFFPENWIAFFTDLGWVKNEIRFYSDVSLDMKRSTPMPFVFKLITLFVSKEKFLSMQRLSGYMLLSKK